MLLVEQQYDERIDRLISQLRHQEATQFIPLKGAAIIAKTIYADAQRVFGATSPMARTYTLRQLRNLADSSEFGAAFERIADALQFNDYSDLAL